MKHFLTILLTLLAIVSCQQKADIAEFELLDSQENSYTISPEQALANLQDFLLDEQGLLSKSSSLSISSLSPIVYTPSLTKSGDSEEDLNCNTLLYVANFENESGFAILAADSRIEDTVIAISDEGSLSDELIYLSMELLSGTRPIFSDYPLDGPGFFTTPETGDEVFINPNTVDFYDESLDDTMVGNYDLDGEEYYYPAHLVAPALCVSYALNEISDYNASPSSNNLPTTDQIEIAVGLEGCTSTSTTTPWETKELVSPILADFATWHQDSPFNDLYPEKRKYVLFGEKQKAPAGCFPLAIAKILTHFEHPVSFIYNGYEIDWKELKNSFSTSAGKLSAAYLLKGISFWCDSWYFYQGTFTFPNKAISFMQTGALLNNVQKHDYSFNKVKSMMKEGCPVIIYSIPGISITNSHSWNIDGYKIKQRTTTTEIRRRDDNSLVSSRTTTSTINMVHCDFGWRGYCNGYYVSGVFKLNDSSAELDSEDEIDETDDNTHYNNYLHIITYDKP